MQKESLEIAVDIIIDALDKSDINIMDKVELMRNLKTLLENYIYKFYIIIIISTKIHMLKRLSYFMIKKIRHKDKNSFINIIFIEISQKIQRALIHYLIYVPIIQY